MERFKRMYSFISNQQAFIYLKRLNSLLLRAGKGFYVNLLGNVSAALLGLLVAFILTSCNSHFQAEELPIIYQPIKEENPSNAVLFKDHITYDKKKFAVSEARVTSMANDRSFEVEARININNEQKEVKLKGFAKTDKKNEFLFSNDDKTIKSKLTCLNLNEANNQVSCTEGFFDFYYLVDKENFVHDQYVLGQTLSSPKTSATNLSESKDDISTLHNSTTTNTSTLGGDMIATDHNGTVETTNTVVLTGNQGTTETKANTENVITKGSSEGISNKGTSETAVKSATDYENSNVESNDHTEDSKSGSFVGNQDADVMELFPEIATMITARLPKKPSKTSSKPTASSPTSAKSEDSKPVSKPASESPAPTIKPGTQVIKTSQPEKKPETAKQTSEVTTKEEKKPEVKLTEPKTQVTSSEAKQPEVKTTKPQTSISNQIGTGLTKVTDQVVGGVDSGYMENATNLLALSNENDSNSFFRILAPAKKRYFAAFEMASILKFLGEYVKSKLKKIGLVIGDVSQEKGGTLYSLDTKTKKYVAAHLSHKVGLDADISYLVNKDSLIFNSVLGNGEKLDSGFLIKDQWELFKVAYQTSMIDIIFIDEKIKAELCKMALQNKEITSYKDDQSFAGQLLSKLIPLEGHYHHFHMRLKCSKDQPRCRQLIYGYKGMGCS